MAHILERSEGVSLYVERVCHDLRHGYLSVARLGEFPRGLGGVFWHDSWRDMERLLVSTP